MSENLLTVTFDNTPEEIETAYKVFQNKYTLRRKLLYTVVYLIVIILAADLILKDQGNPAGYIAGGLALGILVYNWIKPVLIQKRMMSGLAALGTDETYILRLFDDRIEIETQITEPAAETETVAITSHGVYKVEEGSDAAKELAEHPELIQEPPKVEKTVYRFAETEICMSDVKELLLVFVNRTYIHAIPKRCLSTDEVLSFKSWFEEKGLT